MEKSVPIRVEHVKTHVIKQNQNNKNYQGYDKSQKPQTGESGKSWEVRDLARDGD